MITKTSIAVINFYQMTLSPILKIMLGTNKFCRFDESCSDFTKRSIQERGFIKGTGLGLIRLAKCQPFYKGNLGKEVIV